MYRELTDDARAGSSSGTPGLKRAIADCYDFRYEIYPQSEDVLSAGVFYKQLFSAIENIVQPGSEYTSYQNIAHCTNYGLELVAMKNFGNFAVNANYTYTHSAIVVPKIYDVITNGVFDSTTNKNQTRSLVGQSPNLFNLSLSYRIPNWGFRFNIVYTMQGYYLSIPSTVYKEDLYQANYNNLGLTLDQKIGKRFVVVVKLSNILNSPVVTNMRDQGNLLFEKKYNYQSYYIGLKFNL